MFPKRLLALTLFATLAVMPPCMLHAQWVQTNGPWGGTVQAFTFQNGSLFAGTWGDGIFRSTDNGASWTPSSTGLTNGAVQTFAIVGTNIFAGTDSGVYLTSDNGNTWHGSGLTSYLVSTLFSNGTTLFAATDGGTFRSTDNGKNWTTIGINAASFASIGSSLFASVYVGMYEGGFVESIDDGITWTSAGVSQVLFAPLAVMGTTLFGGTHGAGVWSSTDSGASWLPDTNGFSNADISSLIIDDSNIYVSDSWRLWHSRNRGASWDSSSDGISNVIGFGPLEAVGSTLFAGSFEDQVFRSSDSGETWTAATDGITDADIAVLATVGTNLFAAENASNGLFLSTDNGTSWSTAGLSGYYVDDLAVMGTTLFAVANGPYGIPPGGIFRSRDNGKSWILIDTEPTTILTVSGTNLFAANDSVFYYSSDSGSNWIAQTVENEKNLGVGGYGGASLFAAIGTTLFAAAEGPDEFPTGVVLRSTDLGATWTSLATPMSYFYYLFANGTSLFAVSYNDSIYRSTDSGNSWKEAFAGLPGNGISSFTASGSNLFVSDDKSGVYFSIDNGTTWESKNTGLIPFYGITCLVANGTNLFAGTNGYSVWDIPLSDFGISSVAQTSTVTEPSIQIYPNPFSQSTQITFTSQAAGYAEVSIVNMLGVEVARLFSGELGAGEHNFIWGNPTGLPDGVYECLVRMNGQVDDRSSTVQTLPVVLMR